MHSRRRTIEPAFMSFGLIAAVAIGVYLGLMLFHRPQEIWGLVEGAWSVVIGLAIIGVVIAVVASPFVGIYFLSGTELGATLKKSFYAILLFGGAAMAVYYWFFMSIAHIKFISRRKKIAKPLSQKWLLTPVVKQMVKQFLGYGMFSFILSGGLDWVVVKLGFFDSNDIVPFVFGFPIAAILIYPAMFHSARGQLVQTRRAARKLKNSKITSAA